jgi:putative membrane protein
MAFIAELLVGTVAALHVWFMILEMFLWDRPLGLKTFRQSIEKAQATKMLAVNQGLYNGFLAAGLIWGLLHTDAVLGFQVKVFFLMCVTSAGILGACTVGRKILFVQAFPAILGLILLFFGTG